MPDNQHQVKDFLLDPYFQEWVKAPNTENNAYWQEFLHQNPEAASATAEAKKLVLQLNFQEAPRSENVKRRVKSAIDQAIQEGLTAEDSSPPSKPFVQEPKEIFYNKKWVGIAASITGLLLLAATYFIIRPAASFIEYTTAYGETKTVTLPDQSVVTLNANSTLRIEEGNWENPTGRSVWLSGEAFFKVNKRKTREGAPIKFVVHSSNVQVEVLGTQFNVNSRRSKTQVVLRVGKVKLNIHRDTAQEEVLMKPGQMVAVDEQKPIIEKKTVDPSQYTAWTENKLVFENTSIAAIKQLIEDNYGFQVQVNNATLLQKAFSGTAPADDLDILLDKLALIYHLNITKDGNKITLEEK
uniref:FecR domain-containing protein n=1 Tax=Roseihalotalea indica TaxID=2867963 RepID=A0AA49GT76_9BACT|nr:FecR domain-containing protein [Tunicatimonas sp. TK19036]